MLPITKDPESAPLLAAPEGSVKKGLSSKLVLAVGLFAVGAVAASRHSSASMTNFSDHHAFPHETALKSITCLGDTGAFSRPSVASRLPTVPPGTGGPRRAGQNIEFY